MRNGWDATRNWRNALTSLLDCLNEHVKRLSMVKICRLLVFELRTWMFIWLTEKFPYRKTSNLLCIRKCLNDYTICWKLRKTICKREWNIFGRLLRHIQATCLCSPYLRLFSLKKREANPFRLLWKYSHLLIDECKGSSLTNARLKVINMLISILLSLFKVYRRRSFESSSSVYSFEGLWSHANLLEHSPNCDSSIEYAALERMKANIYKASNR